MSSSCWKRWWEGERDGVRVSGRTGQVHIIGLSLSENHWVVLYNKLTGENWLLETAQAKSPAMGQICNPCASVTCHTFSLLPTVSMSIFFCSMLISLRSSPWTCPCWSWWHCSKSPIVYKWKRICLAVSIHIQRKSLYRDKSHRDKVRQRNTEQDYVRIWQWWSLQGRRVHTYGPL